jgi:ABC-type multidrug transport system fused ATPase/permease subunit
MSDTLYLTFWNCINPKRKKQLLLLLVLIVLTSFAEIFSIGAVFPFLAVLTNPEKVYAIEKLKIVWKILEVNSSSEILIYVTIFFSLAAILSGFMRLLLIYATTRLSFGAGADISFEIYRRTLYQPYSIHINRNSAEVISGITSKASSVVTQILTPVLTLLSSGIILLTILISLMIIDPYVTVVSFVFFSFLYLVIGFYYKNKLQKNGIVLSKNLTIVQRTLQEGLGGIRDILLDGTQSYYLMNYQTSDALFRVASAQNSFYGASPRYLMESLGMVILGLFAYQFGKSSESMISAIPMLGSLAIAAQRVLPILQQSYYSWSNLRAGRENLSNVVELLTQPMDPVSSTNLNQKQKFEDKIELNHICFRYHLEQDPILSEIQMTIPKGSRVGIVGKTGSGKSTLMDILMGLLEPTNGEVLIDGILLNSLNVRHWQNHIAHVPQNIFLTDSSIGENIAFGIPKESIDLQKVKQAAIKAQISQHIESLPKSYDTMVGERGVKLSGGQKQRIGIARALYKDASVIFLDEATSALDNETEKEVIQSIESLDNSITLFIIAHRLSTIQGCDQVIELSQGRIVQHI